MSDVLRNVVSKNVVKNQSNILSQSPEFCWVKHGWQYVVAAHWGYIYITSHIKSTYYSSVPQYPSVWLGNYVLIYSYSAECE